jgi:hypothetical protein
LGQSYRYLTPHVGEFEANFKFQNAASMILTCTRKFIADLTNLTHTQNVMKILSDHVNCGNKLTCPYVLTFKLTIFSLERLYKISSNEKVIIGVTIEEPAKISVSSYFKVKYWNLHTRNKEN